MSAVSQRLGNLILVVGYVIVGVERADRLPKDGVEPFERVRVFSEHPGIKVVVNKALAATIPASEAIVAALVKSLSESFANTYYKATDILPADDAPGKDHQEGAS